MTGRERQPMMNEQKTHGSWIQRLPRVPLDRWLPQKYNSRTTLMVIAVFTGTMLLLHTSGTMHSPAALSDHYNRIRSAAYNRFKNVFKSYDEDAIEPLSSTYCSPACPCACRPWRGPHDADPPMPAISNCGRTADRRGRHQNVLAYTYFGTNVTAYLSGIKENAKRALKLYPSWTMRVYHNGKDDFPAWNKTACEVICQFPQVDFCDVRHLPGLGDISNQTATVWRFAVIADESVDRFLMRDLDSILTARERSAVSEWLGSNKTFHTMRDHPYHGSPILAGMWGGWNRYNEKYRVMRHQMFEAVNPIGELWWDQNLLASILWPELARSGDVMTHDSYQCMFYPHTRPFPTRRNNRTEFVGSQYTRTTLTIEKTCPRECRPPKHRDWIYC